MKAVVLNEYGVGFVTASSCAKSIGCELLGTVNEFNVRAKGGKLLFVIFTVTVLTGNDQGVSSLGIHSFVVKTVCDKGGLSRIKKSENKKNCNFVIHFTPL